MNPFTLSSRLKRYRLANNLTQQQVANHLEISVSAYNHYESGARTPNADTLGKLAQLYKLEDQILGVHQSPPLIPQTEEFSMKDLITELPFGIQQNYLPASLSLGCTDKKIWLTKPQFLALSVFFSSCTEHKKRLFHEIASSNQANEGKLYEALVYAWLDRQGIIYTPQPFIKAGEALKRNDYDADGCIDNCVFDVKMYGISHPNISRLQARLNDIAKDLSETDSRYENYYITVSGNLDIANDQLEELLRTARRLLEQLFDDTSNSEMFDYIADELNKDEKSVSRDYFLKICNGELELRANCMKNRRIVSTISEFNPYKWALDNQYYFFHHASQFCHERPYIIICPYDHKLARLLTISMDDCMNTAFRSLCRRMFMGMPADRYIQDYDRDAVPMVSLRDAAACVSAVIFIDVAMGQDCNDDTWIYLNPNARNKMPRYVAEQFRRHMRGMVEDFLYDFY